MHRHTYIHKHMCVYTYIYTHIYIYLSYAHREMRHFLCVCMYVCMYVCIYRCLYVDRCVFLLEELVVVLLHKPHIITVFDTPDPVEDCQGPSILVIGALRWGCQG